MKTKITKHVDVQLKCIHVDAGVRYWEDATVDGIEDEKGDLIPCKVGERWKPIIDVKTGRIYNWEIGKTADIHYKICDDGQYNLFDEENELVHSVDGYVPECMAPERNGYGDYIIMEVDADGVIKGWGFDVDKFLEE